MPNPVSDSVTMNRRVDLSTVRQLAVAADLLERRARCCETTSTRPSASIESARPAAAPMLASPQSNPLVGVLTRTIVTPVRAGVCSSALGRTTALVCSDRSAAALAGGRLAMGVACVGAQYFPSTEFML